jgi:hypothetical protein
MEETIQNHQKQIKLNSFKDLKCLGRYEDLQSFQNSNRASSRLSTEKNKMIPVNNLAQLYCTVDNDKYIDFFTKREIDIEKRVDETHSISNRTPSFIYSDDGKDINILNITNITHITINRENAMLMSPRIGKIDKDEN